MYQITFTPKQYRAILKLLHTCVISPDCNDPWHKVLSYDTSKHCLELLNLIDPDLLQAQKLRMSDSELNSILEKAGYPKRSSD